MTTPGAADTTPTVGGSEPIAATDASGAAREDAPDLVGTDSVHTPGGPPGLAVLGGPAAMAVGKPSKRKSRGRK